MENKDLTSNTGAKQPKDTWSKIIVGGAAILLCVCILAGGIFLSTYARPYLETKTIVFEPDYSKVSEVDKAVLEKTARILTERCDYMGCKSVTFTVSENNQIVGKIPMFLDMDIESVAKEITAIGLLEFTDFGETPFPEGTTITTDFEHPFFPQMELENAWHTIMTNHEIASASVFRNQLGQYVIEFTLTEAGTKIFTQYTSENVGSYLGIILDKVVLSAPQVNEPITSGQGQISGNFTEESARSLAAYLNITPLPIPLVVVDIGE